MLWLPPLRSGSSSSRGAPLPQHPIICSWRRDKLTLMANQVCEGGTAEGPQLGFHSLETRAPAARALRAPAPEQPLGALCPRGRGARHSLFLLRPRNLSGAGTAPGGGCGTGGPVTEWAGGLGRRLCRSSRLTRGQGGVSRGAEPSSGAASFLAGAPFPLVSLQAITGQRTLLPFCCPRPSHPVALCRLGILTLL